MTRHNPFSPVALGAQCLMTHFVHLWLPLLLQGLALPVHSRQIQASLSHKAELEVKGMVLD